MQMNFMKFDYLKGVTTFGNDGVHNWEAKTVPPSSGPYPRVV